MTDAHGPSARVRVTSPRTSRTRRRSVSSEIDAQTELGELYMRSLVRSQLRLAVGVLAILGLLVGLLPALLAAVPSVRTARLVGVPVPWLVLGVLVYPCLVGIGLAYVRRAERNEKSFSDLVDRR